jgi:hypothetical protein
VLAEEEEEEGEEEDEEEEDGMGWEEETAECVN